jgi:hypothetical protein
MELLMAAYKSTEQERTLAFLPEGLEAFLSAVARGSGVLWVTFCNRNRRGKH